MKCTTTGGVVERGCGGVGVVEWVYGGVGVGEGKGWWM